MARIRLFTLTLHNFKGMTFTLKPSGADLSVFGANGTGKTVLDDAFSWLLCDKDSLGRTDFPIKNINSMGAAEHGLEHSVEVILDIDGDEVTLKKTYREQWTKKRGAAQAVFSGHTTDYAIDGVPCQKKDYQARIAEIAESEEILRLLTNPTAFAALPWQKQRTLLLEVCGDISDDDVIAANPRLENLPGVLGKRTLDDHRKIITARRAEINKELVSIPVRIDEQRRSLPDVSRLDRAEVTATIERLDRQIADAKLRLQGSTTGGRIAELTCTLNNVDFKLQQMRNGHTATHSDTLNQLNQQIQEIQEAINHGKRRLDSLDDEINRLTKESADLTGILNQLRQQWRQREAEKFQDTTEAVCPACGQNLPSDRIQEARNKALADFNLRKAEALTEIEHKGKTRKVEQEEKNKAINTMIAEKEGLYASISVKKDKLKSLIVDLEASKSKMSDYSSISGYTEVLQSQAKLLAEIKKEQDGRAVDVNKINAEITDLQGLRTLTVLDLDKFVTREKAEQRIGELMAAEKKLATEFEKIEGELYICDLCIRLKVGMLTERINSRFELVRWKLFEEQVNGGLSECCEITVNGIPYGSGLNNAGKINAGLDVCRTLARHYNLYAPIFVDNAESVCKLLPMDTQLIRLVVNEKDKMLRAEETESAKMAVAA
jgi:chromosome segregation ATPase